MRSTLRIPLLIFLICTIQSFSQETIQFAPSMYGANSWKYSADLSEEDLYQYERLLYMSREDWDLFRADPRYNDAKVRQIYNDHKGKLSLKKGSGSSKSLSADNCDCWVEPDNSYTSSNVQDWPNCSGGGPGVDCWIGPINLPFNFCFFGQNFNQIYLTSKGTISFTPGYIDWTPSEFPNPTNTDTQYDHICGFWADFDFRATGELFYKVTDDAFYLNYVDVGYFANHDNLTNTFQIILAAEDSGILPGDNNVQFCYKDMQWAHGDVGGSGGFSGPTPANVGADRLTGPSHVQFGRFNLNNGNYNGPYGQAANQQDGVNWLDNKTLTFNTCITGANIPPLGTTAAPCDTIFMCQGQVYNLNMSFLSPEAGQSTTITTTQTGTGLTASATAGNTANLTASFTASASNIGTHNVTITATDNGAIPQSTVYNYVFVVLDVVPPTISISGELSICAGGETLLAATSGFDSYFWSTGCDTQECLVDDGGSVTVTGFTGSCVSTATVTIDATEYFIPTFVGGNGPISLCPGITQDVCLEDEWSSYFWEILPGYAGSIPNGVTTDAQCFQINGSNPGYYRVTVENEVGCQGVNIQQVVQIESFIDESNSELSGAYCSGLEPIEFIGGYSNPASGNLLIYCQDQSSAGWQGAYLSVALTHSNGTTETSIMTTNTGFQFFSLPITLGDTFVLTYVSNGNATLDANNFFWVVNCNGEIYQSPIGMSPGVIYEGTSSCQAQELNGTWTVSGPAGWSLTTTTSYNPISNGVESPNIFTPGDYGTYELCFTDPTCDLDYCYNFEYTESPQISLSTADDVLLCGGQSQFVSATVTDIGGTGEISWTGTGLNVSPNSLSAEAGGYSGYTTVTISASITNGCGTATDSFNINHQPNVPSVTLTDGVLCDGSTAILDPVNNANDNPSLSYTWSNSETSPTLTISTAGTYCVTVSNLCGSSNEICAEYLEAIAPSVSSITPQPLTPCTGDPVVAQIDVTNLGSAGTISWTGQGVVPFGNQQSAQVNASGSQYLNYSISATVENVCGSATTTFAVVYSPAIPTLNNNALYLCENSTVTIDPISSALDNSLIEYTWATGEVTPTLTVNVPGNYCVVASNTCASQNACVDVFAVSTANVEELEPQIIECDVESIILETDVPTGYSVEWTTGSTTPSIVVGESGEYCFTLTDIYGCSTQFVSCTEIIFGDYPLISSSLYDTLIICPNECDTIRLFPINATNYEWTSTCPQMVINNLNDGSAIICGSTIPLECEQSEILVTATASNICGTATNIFVMPPNPCGLFIPNVFTPNGDDKNRTFTIGGISNYPGSNLTIFDRWGNQIFFSESYNNTWGPRDLSSGTYYYVLELPFGNTRLIKGTFTVLN